MSRLIVAGVVLLAAVLGLLGAATWNRGGAANDRFTLTESELALPWNWGLPSRNSVDVELRFDWNRRGDPLDARTWLTSDRLQALGFNTAVPAAAPEAGSVYGRTLPRLAWVAFEYGGEEWKRLEQQRRLSATAKDRWSFLEPSRLVPIDAAPDRDALRRRHAGQPVIVMRAVVRLVHQEHPGRGTTLYGVVDRLVSESVSIPARLRSRLDGLTQAAPPMPRWQDGDPLREPLQPRYEVDIEIGRLGVPWILDIRRR